MADEQTPIGVDASGYEVLTKAVAELLNSYPFLEGRVVSFEELDETSGIAFSADNGPLIMTETRDVVDHVEQKCQFPFFLVYRTASTRSIQKIKVQTFLDTIGKWICKEPAMYGDTEFRLTSYPELAGGRKITRVVRQNSYGVEPNDKGVQDWLLPISVEYTNEFDDE